MQSLRVREADELNKSDKSAEFDKPGKSAESVESGQCYICF